MKGPLSTGDITKIEVAKAINIFASEAKRRKARRAEGASEDSSFYINLQSHMGLDNKALKSLIMIVENF